MAGKMMAMIFWDARGILYTDYLGEGQTITGAYYTSLLRQLSENTKKKRPHLEKNNSNYYIHLIYRIWPPMNFFHF